MSKKQHRSQSNLKNLKTDKKAKKNKKKEKKIVSIVFEDGMDFFSAAAAKAAILHKIKEAKANLNTNILLITSPDHTFTFQKTTKGSFNEQMYMVRTTTRKTFRSGKAQCLQYMAELLAGKKLIA